VELKLVMQDRVTSPLKFIWVLESPGATWRATSTRELHLWWKMKSNLTHFGIQVVHGNCKAFVQVSENTVTNNLVYVMNPEHEKD